MSGRFSRWSGAALAEAEARNGETAAALATLDHALEDFESSGQRWFDAELHRMRGEILLEQNPADPGLAEEAFLAAIAVARHQKTRSFELRAALALAKLYRFTGRTPTRTPSSRPRSKALRRRWSLRKSRRRWK